MKKLISLVLISLMIIAFSANVFASNPVLGNEPNNTTTITGNEYENAQKNNATTLPQTGVENYSLGIILVVCAASAIFAYKKVSDYKGI